LLSLFPAVERSLQIVSPEKILFLSQINPPVFSKFFENEIAETSVVLTFHNVNIPYKYSGNLKGKKCGFAGLHSLCQLLQRRIE
jgi:hypothetical protein